MKKQFPNILSTSKRSPVKLGSVRGAKFYNIILQRFLKGKNIQHYSRYTDKIPSKDEKVF